MKTDDRQSENAAISASFAQLGLSREVLALAWEARANLTWGMLAADVEVSLLVAGVDEPTARAILEICLRERANSLRRKGARDTLVGVVLLALALLGILGVIWLEGFIGRQGLMIPSKLLGLLLTGCILPGLYGGYLLVRGLDRVVFGARADGADSDVDEWT
jgi:hypothetical protein